MGKRGALTPRRGTFAPFVGEFWYFSSGWPWPLATWKCFIIINHKSDALENPMLRNLCKESHCIALLWLSHWVTACIITQARRYRRGTGGFIPPVGERLPPVGEFWYFWSGMALAIGHMEMFHNYISRKWRILKFYVTQLMQGISLHCIVDRFLAERCNFIAMSGYWPDMLSVVCSM